MAKVVVEKRLGNLIGFAKQAELLADPRWKREAHRGVIDAMRKTRTKVQRAVADQMGVAPGSYQSYVVSNIRFRSNLGSLSASIHGSAKGGQITDFKGLRGLSPGGRVARSAAAGKTFVGTVKSGVWNNPRVFKRSFVGTSGFFALIRSSGRTGSTMPKQFWTHDQAQTQDRDSNGRFADTGAQRWRVRRLRGPALNKELDKGQSLAVFMTVGPAELETQVMKRINRLMKW